MRSRTFISALLLASLAACTNAPAPAEPANGPTVVTPEPGSAPEKLPYPEVLVKALNGDHGAEFELGAMFHDGDGVGKDYAKAIEWYTKSADAGNRQAQFNLGLMYRNAEGIPEDLALARKWFGKAADTGDVKAAFQIGQMYYLGNGITKDFAKALEHYLKAATGGLPEAQMNAGVMYVRGEGVPAQDMVEAYAWLLIAKNAGNDRAATLFDSLSAKMTDEQRKTGDDRVAALKKEILEKAGPSARL